MRRRKRRRTYRYKNQLQTEPPDVLLLTKESHKKHKGFIDPENIGGRMG